MANLINLLQHMAGKAVLVNGTQYRIDDKGVASNVAEADAAKLLQSKSWVLDGPEAAGKREKLREAKREEFKRQQGGVPLITNQGDVVATPVAEVSDKPAKVKRQRRNKRTKPGCPEEDAGIPVTEAVPSELKTMAFDEQGTIGGEDEWPDPDSSMKKAFLQDMANAYGLGFSAQTTKPELVTMIHRAMYDEV